MTGDVQDLHNSYIVESCPVLCGALDADHVRGVHLAVTWLVVNLAFSGPRGILD
jgi:hypothetical protein